MRRTVCWKLAAVALVALCAVPSFALQLEGRAKPKSPIQNPKFKIQNQGSPVTQREVAEAFQKVESAINRVILKSSKAASAKKGVADKPATRAQIVREMNRLFEIGKSKFKFTPRKAPINRSVVSFPAGTTEQKMSIRLMEWGFVGEVAALVTNKAPGMSVRAFGDALGMFLARMADLTHTPSSEFSPYMNQHLPPGG